MIEIWAPRYHDNVVLIKRDRVCDGENIIIFTKAKHLLGKKFVMDGSEIRKYAKDSNGKDYTNGKILCYGVPMDKLIERK